MKQSIIPIFHLNNNPFQFLALVYFPALRFPQSRFLSVYTHCAPLTFFLRFQTGAGAFKMVFYTRCKQLLWLLLFFKKTKQNKNKTKTEKKLKEMFSFTYP